MAKVYLCKSLQDSSMEYLTERVREMAESAPSGATINLQYAMTLEMRGTTRHFTHSVLVLITK